MMFFDLFTLFPGGTADFEWFLMIWGEIFWVAVSFFNDLFDLFYNFARKHARFLMMCDDVSENFPEGSVDF